MTCSCSAAGTGTPWSASRSRSRAIERRVHLVAARIQVGAAEFTILAFEPAPSTATPPGDGASSEVDGQLQRLERELVISQDSLRRSLGELQAVNEELEASSEELQASSEELQASNEELEASNEELQATNEELGTLNQQLAARGDDLQVVNTELENIQASLSQGMVIVDPNLLVTMFTPMAVRVFALLDSDVGQPLLAAPTTVEIPGLEDALRAVVAGAPRRSIEAQNGDVAYLVQVLPYRAPDGHHIGAIVTLTDVSELVELRQTAETALVELQGKSDLLTQQATFDAVTGLLNRGYFGDLVQREVVRSSRGGGRLALAWIDLDRFKEVNDEFGHETGDVTLRTVGERVHENVRGSDFVGRLGGDEIGIVIAGYQSPAELDRILERIVVAVREPILSDGQSSSVTASIGVALYPEDALYAKDLMRAADAAMYDVKRQGGDGYGYFDASMNLEAGLRRTRRLELARAIGEREFVMHYQPIVDASTGSVWGVEALVRWARDGQIVSADEFIPFCEESGQIRQLGLLTLDLVRADVRALRAHGHGDLKTAYNMSVTQLEDRHFGDVVATVPPEGLSGVVVEVIESVFLPDRLHALRAIDDLTRLGAEISIDDYGAGYSNVRLLESLSPAYIKLDRTFLSEHHSDESRSVLIRSAVEVSHVVGARVIAEGIEDDAQLQLVREAGADFVQGYGIARPMPLEDLLLWLDQRPLPAPGT